MDDLTIFDTKEINLVVQSIHYYPWEYSPRNNLQENYSGKSKHITLYYNFIFLSEDKYFTCLFKAIS